MSDETYSWICGGCGGSVSVSGPDAHRLRMPPHFCEARGATQSGGRVPPGEALHGPHQPARTEHEMSRHGRVVGETYRDACERLAGQLRAAQHDLARHEAQRHAVLALADEWERATSLLMPPVVAGLIRQALGGGL